MDYEKEYKSLVAKVKKAHQFAQTDSTKSVLEDILPQLREINEAEIRKDIIGGLMWQRDNLKSEGPHDNNLILPGFCFTVGKHLAYLEKQKNLDKMIVVSPEVWEDAFSDAFENGKKEGEKQKEPEKEELAYRLNGLMQEYINEAKDQEEEEHRFKCYKLFWNALEDASYFEQKEQKPISTEDMPYVADEHFFEREPADTFKYRLAEYMTKNCKKGEGPYGYSYNISSESILQMAKEELIKRGELKEPKPAWSEEDEKILNELLDHCNTENATWYNWLKSLRPQPQQNMSIGFMLYLDEHRPDGKMCLSNAECNEIEAAFKYQSWDTILRYAEKYQPHWKPSEKEKGALRTAIHILTDERSFPKAAAQLQNILDAFEGKESRKDWKPSEEQMRHLRYALTPGSVFDCDILNDLYEHLQKLM